MAMSYPRGMTDVELRRLAEAVMTEGAQSSMAVPAAYIAALDPQTVLALLDRIDAVRAIHVETEAFHEKWLRVCGSCRQHWPCPTIRALNGES